MPIPLLMAGALLFASAGGFHQTVSAPQQNPAGTTTIRREVNLVSVYCTVRDGKHRLVPNLGREQFQVFEDKREQQILFFSHQTDVPLNLGILLDTSTSLPRLLGLEADSANAFLRGVLKPKDLAFVVSYDNRVRVLQVPTAELDLLEEKIDSIRRYGTASENVQVPSWPLPIPNPLPGPFPGPIPGPLPQPNHDLRVARLYDALSTSVPRFLADEVGRKAVVIVALADDARSESSLEDALRTLQQSDVIAYVLQMYDGPRDYCDVRHIYRAGHLRRLAEETGGRVLEVRGMDRLQAALDEIAEELHNQYSLAYRPMNQHWDGRFRRIEIRVRGGGRRVQARKGYYATPRASR